MTRDIPNKNEIERYEGLTLIFDWLAHNCVSPNTHTCLIGYLTVLNISMRSQNATHTYIHEMFPMCAINVVAVSRLLCRTGIL